MTKEIRIAVGVLWITLIVLCTLLTRNINAVNRGNETEQLNQFQRMLVSCNNENVNIHADPRLYELCRELRAEQ